MSEEYREKAKKLDQIVALIKSGYAGVNQKGTIVDRREHPDAIPCQGNSIFGTPEPKELPRNQDQ